MASSDYAAGALFIFLSGMVVILWCLDKRKGKTMPFPWRELVICVVMIAAMLTNVIRDNYIA
jgi:uncharacterized membrane protein